MYDIELIKPLVAKCVWKWAKTYRNIPHEYIVRDKCPLSQEEFDYFVGAQRALGIYQIWGKYNFPYLHLDGYKYWTMGSPIEETTVINRQKLFGEYDQIAERYDSLFEDDESKARDRRVSEMLKPFSGSVYDLGCGTGRLLSLKQIPATEYQGIDPSGKMLELFRRNHNGYYKTVRRKAFEEDASSYLSFENTISLYGSVSYVMPVYLQMLAENHRSLFLMFYKPDYIPLINQKTSVTMHHFMYREEELQKLFCGCHIFGFDDYIIVWVRNREM